MTPNARPFLPYYIAQQVLYYILGEGHLTGEIDIENAFRNATPS